MQRVGNFCRMALTIAICALSLVARNRLAQCSDILPRHGAGEIAGYELITAPAVVFCALGREPDGHEDPVALHPYSWLAVAADLDRLFLFRWSILLLCRAVCSVFPPLAGNHGAHAPPFSNCLALN